MRILELVILLTVLGGALSVVFTRGMKRPLNVLNGAALLVGVVLSIYPGLRWQLVPVLALAVVLAVIGWRGRKPVASEATRPRRRLWSIVGRAGVALAIPMVLAPSVLSPMFDLPDPTGPFAVGTTALHFVDASRAETFTEDPLDRRELPVRAWYPAESEPGGRLMRYDETGLLGRGLAGALGFPTFLFSHLGDVRTHASVDAPLARTPSPHPVLIFSHGYGGSSGQSTFLMEELASHGYVVFSMDHPYESLPVELESGRVTELRGQSTEDLMEFFDEMMSTMDELLVNEDSRENHEALLRRLMGYSDLDASFEIWVADGRFLLDELEGVAQSHPAFGGRLDMSRVGLFGHSFGGAMAAQICSVDDRCTAGINLDGGQLGSVIDTGLGVPFMIMYGEHSRWLNHIVHARSTGPSYQLAVMGSGHLDFSDLPMIAPVLGWTSRFAPIPQVGRIGSERMYALTNAYVRAFFDRYLSGKPSELLDGPSQAYPEVLFEFRPGSREER